MMLKKAKKNHRVSGPVTSVARVQDVQIFLKYPVFFHLPKKINIKH